MGWNNWGNNDNRRNNGGWGGRNYDDRGNNNYGGPRNRDYGGGYDDRRGYNNDRGYRDYAPQNNFKFSVGQQCYLKQFPDTVVTIIRCGREQYECRLPDLRTDWFYEHELEAIEMKD